MDLDSRREMIIQAALPLVIEYGSAVTTSQVARAAGIGEGTIFRAFADKNELLDACVNEALSPAHALTELASVSMDQPLPARLAEAAAVLQASLGRVGAVVGALLASGGRRRGERADRAEVPPALTGGSQPVREALAALFEPERGSLRLSPEQAASVFLGLLFVGGDRSPAGGRAADPSLELDVGDLIDICLHGVLSRPAES